MKKTNTFDSKIHNVLLRHLDSGIDEKKSLGHRYVILKNKPTYDYVLGILSGDQINKDNVAAFEAARNCQLVVC